MFTASDARKIPKLNPQIAAPTDSPSIAFIIVKIKAVGINTDSAIIEVKPLDKIQTRRPIILTILKKISIPIIGSTFTSFG